MSLAHLPSRQRGSAATMAQWTHPWDDAARAPRIARGRGVGSLPAGRGRGARPSMPSQADMQTALAQLNAALAAASGNGSILSEAHAKQVNPSQRPALTCQLLFLRHLRAVVPSGSAINEEQLAEALRPLRAHVLTDRKSVV